MNWTIKNPIHLERRLWPLISQVHHTPLIYVPRQIEWMPGVCLKKVKWIEVCVRLLLWAMITSSKLCSDLCWLLSASFICLGYWPKGIILMNWSSVALHALKVNWSGLHCQFTFVVKARTVSSQKQVYIRVWSMLRGVL